MAVRAKQPNIAELVVRCMVSVVPQNGIEPMTNAYKAIVMPLNYRGENQRRI